MQAGSIRDRIEIQNRDTGLDGYGQPNGDWTTDRTCWAEVRELSGRELVNAREIVAEVTTRIRMRGYSGWRTEVTPQSRVVFGSRTFDVLSVLNLDGRERELQMLCIEIVAEGS